ncbi:MAG: 50S ribosomal protein L3 [Gammaproteobacteria bacterium]|nr:50S ribosomal protein L3 [Gammaproteobacteria bacterium]
MTIGVVGRKTGMTRVFTDDGVSTPVTVVEVDPNRVTQLKTIDSDGYRAVQITTGSRRPSRVNKPMSGLFAKANTESGRGLWEFRLNEGEGDDLTIGDTISVDRFNSGQKVDVTGTSIGKGFAGVIKRHNFHMQDATHGNSLSHRAPGSIGQGQTPGHVFKGKKMAGQMGNVKRTTQNLEVIRVDTDRNLILIKGAIPGSKGGDVIIRASVKARNGKASS